MKQSFNSIIFVCAVVLVFAGCSETNKPLSVIEGVTMGTTYTVKIADQINREVNLKTLIDQELIEFNKVFSNYIPDSEISRFNRSEGAVPTLLHLGAFVVKRGGEKYNSGGF